MEYVVTASLLNLRSTPGVADENVITLLKNQEIVDVTDTGNGTFYKVTCINRNPVVSGYAAARYLQRYMPVAPPANQYLKPVNLAPNSASRRNVHANWQFPLGEMGMPKVDETMTAVARLSTMHDIVAYLQVDKSERYQPDVHTYCNIYAYDYCYLAGVFLPRVWWRGKALVDVQAGRAVRPQYDVTVDEINANGLLAWLEDWGADYRWTRTYDLDELQTKVNEGRVGVICAANIHPGLSGHICCVIPENATHSATRVSNKVTCPLLSQAGRHNFQYYNNNRWWVNLAPDFKSVGFWYCDYVANN